MPFDNVPMKTPLSREVLSDIHALRQTRDRIEYGNWCKGEFEKGWNRCVVGWLRFITCDHNRADSIASIYLAPAIPKSITFDRDATPVSRVMTFNDRPYTSRIEMVALIDRAIAMVEGT